jgi:site-specific recombinase XerD
MRTVIYNSNNHRNISIFEMLLSSGLRISELLSLKIDDISLADCKGVCLGKGNKQRVFYFSEKAKLSTIDYLSERRDDNPYLFVQSKVPFNQLGISGAETMIRQIGRKADVPNAHPHRFRRTLATRLIRKGMEIDQVSKILGHESLGITQRYIESDRDMLKLTHNKHVN